MATLKYDDDCHYFLNAICTKPDCNYRHSDSARHTTIVCRYWLNNRCTRHSSCPFRHSHNGLAVNPESMSRRLVAIAPAMPVIAPMVSYIGPKMCKYEHRLPNGCTNDGCVYAHSMPKPLRYTATIDDTPRIDSLMSGMDSLKLIAESAITCKVCLDTREEIDANEENQLMVTSCGHLICRVCLQQIMASYKNCPICRQVIQTQQTIYF